MRKSLLVAAFAFCSLPLAAQTWDVSCSGGKVPQNVTVQSNGHLKAVMCVDSAGTVTPTTAYSSSSSLPSGAIVLSLTSCPSGFSEATALDGVFLQGTLAAHGDVGTTGGNATITPSGTVSQPTFTGSSNQATSAVSAGTPAGTNSTVSFTPAGTNGTTTTGATSAGTPAGTNAATATSGNCAATNIAAGTGSTTACKATAPNLTVPAETFTGSAMSTHTHTVPAETFTGSSGTVPAEIFTGSALGTHSHTLTPAGTVSQPTFTGNAFDPRPQFVKVIFCSAN